MGGLSDLEKERELTRAALTEKIDALEDRARSSIEGVRETIKRTVDLQHQVKKRPLVVLGGSALVGYFLGRVWFTGSSRGESGAQNGTATHGVNPAKAEAGVLKAALTAAMSNLLVDLIKEIMPLRTDGGENTGRSKTQVSADTEKQSSE